MTAAGKAWRCRAFPAAVGWLAAPTIHYEPGRLSVPPKSRVTPKRLGSDRGKYDVYPLPNSLYHHTPAQTCHNDGRRSWHHVPQPQQKHTVRPLSSRQNSEPRCRLVHFGSPPHRHRQRQRDMRLARREQASTAPRSWRSRERDLAICFWSVRLREPGRNKQSRTTRPTQRRVHGSQLDMYRWL